MSNSASLFTLNSPVDYDATRHAYSAYFTFDGSVYYADLVSGSWLFTPHNEVMVFAVEEDGEINSTDLSCSYPPAVDEATLLEHIGKFCMENK